MSRTIGGAGLLITLYDQGENLLDGDISASDVTKLGVALTAFGLTLATGGVAPLVGLGIGTLDALGAFDGIYEFIDIKQNEYLEQEKDVKYFYD